MSTFDEGGWLFGWSCDRLVSGDDGRPADDEEPAGGARPQPDDRPAQRCPVVRVSRTCFLDWEHDFGPHF